MELKNTDEKTIIFNKDKFPLVEVIFNSITNENQYNMFEESWLNLYSEKNFLQVRCYI